jgi:hypothetical protein
MRIWFALIVAPLLALTDQTVAFALVGWGCTHHSVALLHASHLVFLALTTGSGIGAWLTWRQTAVASASSNEAAPLQRHFLAGVATATASLAAIGIVAMWIPTWLISPCIA